MQIFNLKMLVSGRPKHAFGVPAVRSGLLPLLPIASARKTFQGLPCALRIRDHVLPTPVRDGELEIVQVRKHWTLPQTVGPLCFCSSWTQLLRVPSAFVRYHVTDAELCVLQT